MFARLFPIALLVGAWSAASSQEVAREEWPVYGRDPGGSRFSPLTQINPGNVNRLVVAWTYHTGERTTTSNRGSEPSFESTPIMSHGTLYLTTPTGRVIALDAATGAQRWTYDPKVDFGGGYGDFTNRGVALWSDRRPSPGSCARRIFLATIDSRLVSLDAATGAPCRDFGKAGVIDLRAGLRIPPFEFPAYEETSPPCVVGDLVIVGSAIADNSRPNPASGEVRAFDVRTGALRWSWDPIPQDASSPSFATWENGSAAKTGAANVWSVIVADPARDMVFVPTSSAAPDYFGGLRLGQNRDANSIVALRASTGKVLWRFQTVHHDLWDYDNAAPPALATVVKKGVAVPAVVQTTKTGMIYILDRVTGEPLFPVEERRVPASDLPDERAWPTQPFPTVTPPLVPHQLTADQVWGVTSEERDACRAALAPLRNEGIFTPPSTRGTLAIPSNIGGAHWGGVAVDTLRHIVVVPVNRLAAIVQLIPIAAYDRDEAHAEMSRWDFQYTRMNGTPYVMRRRLFLSPTGLPCTPPPFGALVAVSLTTGQTLWNVPLGALPAGDSTLAGSPNLGGPLATASGLIFVGGTLDRALHAFDVTTGKVLWHDRLPAGGKATPMTYESGGRQFVVIAAGGGGRFGSGDAVVAFALPTSAR